MQHRPPPPPGASTGLKAALTLAAAVPLLFVGARAQGLVGDELRWAAVAATPVLALVALLVFEPPRSGSPLAWLRQLRRRLAPRAEPGPPPAAARRERRLAVAARAEPTPPARSEPPVVVDPGAGSEALRATEEYLPRPVDRAPPYPEARLASLGASGELVPVLESRPEPRPAPEEATHRLLPVVTPQPAQAVPVPPAPLVDPATVRQLPPLEGPPPPAVAPVSLKQALEAARARPPRAEPYRKAYEAEAGAAPTRSLPTARPEAPAVQVPVAPAGKRRPSS